MNTLPATTSFLPRYVQAAACLAAVCAGALLAHLIDSPRVVIASRATDQNSVHEPTEPPPLPSDSVFTSAAVRVDAPEPMANALPVESPEESPAEPNAQFGETLRNGQVMTGATSHRMVLFTFDDGPNRATTPRLLDYLDEYGVRAVFFFTASRIAGNSDRELQQQEIARDVVRRGHYVGNHTLDHAQLPLLNNAEVTRQAEAADEVFTRVFGQRSLLFRPPGGARSARVDGLLSGLGYTQMLWNLGTGDFQVRSAEQVFQTWRRVLERRAREHGERGGIILLHDIHPWSVEAVPLILNHLRRANCRLLANGEELYEVVSDPSLFFAPRNGASPSAPVRPLRLSAEALEARQAPLRAAARERCQRLASR